MQVHLKLQLMVSGRSAVNVRVEFRIIAYYVKNYLAERVLGRTIIIDKTANGNKETNRNGQ